MKKRYELVLLIVIIILISFVSAKVSKTTIEKDELNSFNLRDLFAGIFGGYDPKFDILDEDLKECFYQIAKEGIQTVEAQGGYIYLDGEYLHTSDKNIPYAFKDGEIHLISKENLSLEIKKYIEERYRECLPIFMENYDEIESNFYVEIYNRQIDVVYSLDINYFEGERGYNLDFENRAEIFSVLGKLYDNSFNILKELEKNPEDLNIDQLTDLDYDIVITPYSNTDFSYAIIDPDNENEGFVFSINLEKDKLGNCIDFEEDVCGADGVTYPNNCELKKSGNEKSCEGECPCLTDENGEPITHIHLLSEPIAPVTVDEGDDFIPTPPPEVNENISNSSFNNYSYNTTLGSNYHSSRNFSINSSDKIIPCAVVETFCLNCSVECARKICFKNNSYVWQCNDGRMLMPIRFPNNSIRPVDCPIIEDTCYKCLNNFCAEKICYSNESYEWKCRDGSIGTLSESGGIKNFFENLKRLFEI